MGKGCYVFRAALVAIVGLVVMAGPAAAMRTEYNVQSLKGLEGVYIIFQSLDNDIVADGLSQQAVESAVQKRLVDSGITLLSEDELVTRRGGILYVALDSIRNKDGIYACNIQVQLIQVANLSRDHSILVPATTWMYGMVVLAGSNSVGALQNAVLEIVDEFAQDYQTVNMEEEPQAETASIRR